MTSKAAPRLPALGRGHNVVRPGKQPAGPPGGHVPKPPGTDLAASASRKAMSAQHLAAPPSNRGAPLTEAAPLSEPDAAHPPQKGAMVPQPPQRPGRPRGPTPQRPRQPSALGRGVPRKPSAKKGGQKRRALEEARAAEAAEAALLEQERLEQEAEQQRQAAREQIVEAEAQARGKLASREARLFKVMYLVCSDNAAFTCGLAGGRGGSGSISFRVRRELISLCGGSGGPRLAVAQSRAAAELLQPCWCPTRRLSSCRHLLWQKGASGL